MVIINKKNIDKNLLIIFIFICILFPNDFLGIKKISFIILLLCNASLILANIKKINIIAFYGFWFPIILIIHSFLLTKNLENAIYRNFCCFMLLLIIPIYHYNIDFEKYLLNLTWIIVGLTLTIFIFDVIGLFDVNSNYFLRNFFYSQNIGVMGKSVGYSMYYKIFMKTSPLLCFTLFDQIKKQNKIKLCCVVIALIISGTRANVLFAIGLGIIYLIKNNSYNNKWKIIFKFIFIMILLLYLVINIGNLWSCFYEIFFSKGLNSDTVRFGHLQGIFELYRNNPEYILFGSGMGSHFYSYGLNKMVNSIEIPYLDLFRQMGIVLFSIFMIFILKPLFKKNVKKIDKYAYLAYLLIAATNPLVFSSTGFLAYIYIYMKYFKVFNQK